MFSTDAFAWAIMWIFIIAILIGVAIGGFIFEVIPWLYHHISFHWN